MSIARKARSYNSPQVAESHVEARPRAIHVASPSARVIGLGANEFAGRPLSHQNEPQMIPVIVKAAKANTLMKRHASINLN